jgi:hypothetical protein
MCYVWISEQTAIVSLYNTDLLAIITETNSLPRSTNSTAPVHFHAVNRENSTLFTFLNSLP